MLKPMRFIIAVLALCAVLPASVVHASLGIDPAFIEMDLERGRPSDVITVTNVTKQETRYRAQTVHFIYTKDGNFEIVEPDGQSLAPWIKFNPKEFVLAPQESRAIRLSVIPPGNLRDGEYWAALRFEPLVGIVSTGDSGEGHSVAIEVITNINVPVIGHVGKLDHTVGLADLQAWRDVDGIRILTSLKSTGNARARVKGTYEVVDAAGAVVAEGLMGEDTLLAGGERVFVRLAEDDFPDGEFTVRVRYTSDRFEEALAGQTTVRDDAPDGYADVLR